MKKDQTFCGEWRLQRPGKQELRENYPPPRITRSPLPRQQTPLNQQLWRSPSHSGTTELNWLNPSPTRQCQPTAEGKGNETDRVGLTYVSLTMIAKSLRQAMEAKHLSMGMPVTQIRGMTTTIIQTTDRIWGTTTTACLESNQRLITQTPTDHEDMAMAGGRGDGGNGGGGPRGGNNPAIPGNNDPSPPYRRTIPTVKSELKVKELLSWDGNHKTAIQYFWDVQEFADLGGWMPEAMGFWLWSRLKLGSDVRVWFSMLDLKTKAEAKSHYLKYLHIIKKDYLGCTFQDDVNLEYSLQHFRQPGHKRESLWGFVTRHVMYTRMLATADDRGPLEVHFVMLQAPLSWSRILGIDSIKLFKELYARVVEHKKVLTGASRDDDTTVITSDNLVSALRQAGVLQGQINSNSSGNKPSNNNHCLYRQANMVEGASSKGNLIDLEDPQDLETEGPMETDILRQAYQLLKQHQHDPPVGGYPFPKDNHVTTKMG
jgi:hypothetical protein